MGETTGRDKSADRDVEAQQRLDAEDPAAAVRRLLRSQRDAVLSTLSVRRHGWPFGSLAPYALSRSGEPILLLSTLAQHTKNLAVDPRASLFVLERREPEVQSSARATVMGRVRRADSQEIADARARYLARHPEAESYFQQHDFHLYVHSVDEVRLIAGFGAIGWVAGAAVTVPPDRDPLAPHAAELLARVNGDHADGVAALCRSRGHDGVGARAVALDGDGLDVEGAGGRVRFDFPEPARTPGELRERCLGLFCAGGQPGAR
jgi:putative heme iron utilization protein